MTEVTKGKTKFNNEKFMGKVRKFEKESCEFDKRMKEEEKFRESSRKFADEVDEYMNSNYEERRELTRSFT